MESSNSIRAVALSFIIMTASAGLAPRPAAAQTFAAPEPDVPALAPVPGLSEATELPGSLLPGLDSTAGPTPLSVARLTSLPALRPAPGNAARMFDRTGGRFAVSLSGLKANEPAWPAPQRYILYYRGGLIAAKEEMERMQKTMEIFGARLINESGVLLFVEGTEKQMKAIVVSRPYWTFWPANAAPPLPPPARREKITAELRSRFDQLGAADATMARIFVDIPETILPTEALNDPAAAQAYEQAVAPVKDYLASQNVQFLSEEPRNGVVLVIAELNKEQAARLAAFPAVSVIGLPGNVGR